MRRNEASSSGGGAGGEEGGGGGESRVVDVGRRRSSCGYCKSGYRSSTSHGLWAHSLTIADYQDLLDRGWRRSGCFLYKPEMETTCCPAYTIRLRADDFIPSKEQVRVSRQMQRYLDGRWDAKKQPIPGKSGDFQGSGHGDKLPSSSKRDLVETNENNSKEEEPLNYLSEQLDHAIQSFVKSADLPLDISYPKGLVKRVSQTKKRRIVEGSDDLLYTSNVSFQIAAILRRAKPDSTEAPLPGTLKCGSVANGSSDLSPKFIAEMLANGLQQLLNTLDLSVKACNGHINFYSLAKEAPSDQDSQRIASSSKYSTQHLSRGGDVMSENTCRKKQKLEIFLNRSKFDPEEFALYKKYQVRVHNDEPDDITESSYRRFLIDTPLIYVPPTGDDTVPPCGFGSFHQQYRIDGRLIAVGVVDILPKCLSSKYLFWDPDLAFLSLGKYSVLQEISWVKENNRRCSSLQYYYLGYYIHSCPKMRYKAAYRPSELLCPLRYEWVPYDIAKPLLDRTKFVVLSNSVDAQNGVLSSTCEPGENLKQICSDFEDGDLNDTYAGGDEEMLDPESGSLDGEPYPRTESGDVGDLLLGLRETRMRYKDLRRALSRPDQEQLENRLFRYLKVVGPELSKRMVYSLAC